MYTTETKLDSQEGLQITKGNGAYHISSTYQKKINSQQLNEKPDENSLEIQIQTQFCDLNCTEKLPRCEGRTPTINFNKYYAQLKKQETSDWELTFKKIDNILYGSTASKPLEAIGGNYEDNYLNTKADKI